MPRVHASLLVEAALGPLLAELAANLNFAYLETATDATWARYRPDLELTGVLRGRAFGPACDVQFWRELDGYRVRVLSDLSRPLANGDSIDLAGYDTEDVTYLLWGSHDRSTDRWLEAGFARQWSYPLPDAPRRVGVDAREYRDRVSGDLQFIRYRDLVPVNDGEEAS